MTSPDCSTRLGSFSRPQAILVLLGASALLLWLLVAAFLPVPQVVIQGEGGNDLRLYRNIVERVHQGESYYDAAAIELRAQGYPTASIFNWRTPLYAWLIGRLPTPTIWQWIVAATAALALLASFSVMQPHVGPGGAAVGIVLQLGVFLWCFDGEAYLAQELWAGILIVLSISSYGLGYTRLGQWSALVALFYRELALPYVLLCVVLAWRAGRKRELLFWLGGLICYGVYLGLHMQAVHLRVAKGDRMPGSWIQFGGAGFILQTCRMNKFFFDLPRWISALYLPTCLFGLLGWREEFGLRLFCTAAGYAFAFAIVGQPFNDYWGLLYVGLLPFGLVRLPACLRDLRHNLRSQEPSAVVQ